MLLTSNDAPLRVLQRHRGIKIRSGRGCLCLVRRQELLVCNKKSEIEITDVKCTCHETEFFKGRLYSLQKLCFIYDF